MLSESYLKKVLFPKHSHDFESVMDFNDFISLNQSMKNPSSSALRSGDTIASEVLTEAWLLLIEN